MTPASLLLHVFNSMLPLHPLYWQQCTTYPSMEMLHQSMPRFSHMDVSAFYYQIPISVPKKLITTASLTSFLFLPGQNWVFFSLESNCNFHSSPLTCTAINFMCLFSHQSVNYLKAGLISHSFLCTTFFNMASVP